MKTSGVSCETKFGLLGFLGHPIVHLSFLKKMLNGSVGPGCRVGVPEGESVPPALFLFRQWSPTTSGGGTQH